MIDIPALFIFDQPDLGTANILTLVGVAILFIAGVKMWKFIAVGVAGLIAIPFLWFFFHIALKRGRSFNAQLLLNRQFISCTVITTRGTCNNPITQA